MRATSGKNTVVESSPKIAVIITCFNYGIYVGKAIRSVIDQDSRDYELVVIDDGSIDDSWSVIQKTGVNAFQIENGGQRNACMYGLDKTRAPYVLFLDADDELRPGAIKQILRHLDPEVAKVQFCLTCVDSEGRVIADPYPALDAFRSQDRVVDEILATGVYQTPPTSGNVFRRDVCEILRDCGYDSAVDGVILQAAPFLGEIVSLSESLGLYRVHGQNDSGMGGVPRAAAFERDLQRFQMRLAHLRVVIEPIRPDVVLVRAENTYYYQFLAFCAATLRGVPYPPLAFLRLTRAVVTERRSWKWRVATVLFILTTFLAPRRQAQALLTFRFSVGHRSLREFLQIASASFHSI